MCIRRTPSKSPAGGLPSHEKSPLPDCQPKLTGKELHTNSRGAGIVIILCPPLQIKEDFYMKELTSYNRVAGYLNKIFDQLNERYFESALSRPTITIQSTPKAYGHFRCGKIPGYPKTAQPMRSTLGQGRSLAPSKK